MSRGGGGARTRLPIALLALLVLACDATPARIAEPAVPQPGTTEAVVADGLQSFDQNGLRVRMDAVPRRVATGPIHEGDEVRLRFLVGEARDGGRGLEGLTPLAWLVRQGPDAEELGLDDCERTIRGLLLGRIAIRAQVNLNEYLLVTLDDNNSISIIDPQVESSKTKTLGIVSLPGRGEDFVLLDDRRTVLVTLPVSGQLASADLTTRRARYAELGGQPDRVAVQPGGQVAWVGDREGAAVSAVGLRQFGPLGRVEVEPGPHDLAFDEDGRQLFVTSPNGTRLHVIDTERAEVAGVVDLAAPAIGLVYSRASQRVLVALADGSLVTVDPRSPERVASVEVGPAPTRIDVSPDGRWVFVLQRDADRLNVVDAATGHVVHRLPTEARPHRIDFSDTFVYVQHAASEWALLVDWTTLSRDREPVVGRVTLGNQPPPLEARSLAPMLAPLPEGGGVLALHPADRSVYHFMEGMNAPMGAYRTYPWPARGLLLVDRTLREVDTGVYETAFRAPRAGHYSVPFLAPANPQIFGCFALDVGLPPGVDPTTRPELEVVTSGPLVAGELGPLVVRLRSAPDGPVIDGLDDVMVLVLQMPVWQWRQAARPLGDGRYGVEVVLPRAGRYTVMVESPSHGLAFADLPGIAVDAVDADGSGVRQETQR